MSVYELEKYISEYLARDLIRAGWRVVTVIDNDLFIYKLGKSQNFFSATYEEIIDAFCG